jgi:hypothetical protein
MVNWSIEGNLILSNTNQDNENLTNKDALIFMGGTNDVQLMVLDIYLSL